jgi:endonuclease-3
LTDKIRKIISLLQIEFPDQEPKRSKSNPLDVLIATMLSQNTTDKTSYAAFINIKKNFRNWEDVMNSTIHKIRKSIKVCGLANQKAVNIRNLLKTLYSKYNRISLDYIKDFSDEEIYRELLSYKGIGIKTVSCVLAFALGRDVFPVDTHVHRLSNRLGLVSAATPEKTFEQINRIIPDGKKFLLHTLLIRFGRKVCKAKNPLCSDCVLFALCEFSDKTMHAGKRKSLPRENNFIILENI